MRTSSSFRRRVRASGWSRRRPRQPGTAVVVTDQCGVAEWLRPDGALVVPYNADAIAARCGGPDDPRLASPVGGRRAGGRQAAVLGLNGRQARGDLSGRRRAWPLISPSSPKIPASPGVCEPSSMRSSRQRVPRTPPGRALCPESGLHGVADYGRPLAECRERLPTSMSSTRSSEGTASHHASARRARSGSFPPLPRPALRRRSRVSRIAVGSAPGSPTSGRHARQGCRRCAA